VRYSLHWRIFTLVGALLAIVEGASLFVLRERMAEDAERVTRERLEAGRALVTDQLAQRHGVLATHTSTLAKDFGVLEAFHLGGKDLARMLERRRQEVGASFALAVDPRGKVRASTSPSFKAGTVVELPDAGSPPTTLVVDGAVLELHAAPLLAPQRIGTILLGYPLEPLAQAYGRATALDATLVLRDADGVRALASTFDAPRRAALDLALRKTGASTKELAFAEAAWLGAEVPLGAASATSASILLQRSRVSALAEYDQSWRWMLEVFAAALGLALLGAWALARRIVEPIRLLVEQTTAIEAGAYTEPITARPGDEIGELVESFNHMQHAIAERERSIRHHFLHDPLTDLPNRSRLETEIGHAVVAPGPGMQRLGVMVVGLNRFREINDTLGHEAGDQLLRLVADRIRSRMAPDDVVARIGGDEFGILVHDPAAREIQQRLERVAAAFDEPFALKGLTLNAGASVGLAIHPDHGRDAPTLLRHADRALWSAKQKRARYAVFDGTADRYSLLRLGLLAELRAAIEHGDLVLHYQPKLDLARDEVVGAEALVRWQHPVYGLIPPSEFIPMVESTGNISLVTTWALREARRQAVEWRNGTKLRLAVNVSAHDLRNAEFIEQVETLAGSADSELLGFEITESAVVEDVAKAVSTFNRFRELGIKLAIDDYGTGYSSMAQLKRLPVDELKIDQSFVTGVERNADDRIIVRSTIELGHNMGLKVVGEGVETRGALELLQSDGCDMVQGYFLSRPLTAPAFAAWRAAGAWRNGAGAR